IEEVAALRRPTAVGPVLLDARSAARYAGQPDTLDPRAGHIPGARSFPCRDNLDQDGRLLAPEILRRRLASVGVAEGGPATISSCGSGVTACHTLLLLDHLGLPGRLYPGSWSQWSRSQRPAVTGPAPWGS
ncbi:MAG: sulfurtransferase, partial [Acidimicrobiales bacterium]